jgi:transposase
MQQERLIEHFLAGTTARTAGSLVGVNKSTAVFYFHRLPEIIASRREYGAAVR